MHDGLIATHRGVIDSFHLVEQLIGAELSTDLAERIRTTI